MNLLRAFPEIDTFFKQDRFTQENLNELFSKLQEVYTDRITFNSAKTLIELELLKFNLFEEFNICSFKSNTKKERRTESLLTLLKQQHIVKEEEDVLTEEEFSKIKPYIKSRCAAINRLQKEEKKMETFKNFKFKFKSEGEESAGSSNVYDKIAQHGLGKIIYIRSK
jgi:hypothetical protein